MGEYLDMTHANSEETQKKVDSDKEPTENIAETAKQEKTEQWIITQLLSESLRDGEVGL